jgi:pimeloyl-ACP methyl ester carboxylesterase
MELATHTDQRRKVERFDQDRDRKNRTRNDRNRRVSATALAPVVALLPRCGVRRTRQQVIVGVLVLVATACSGSGGGSTTAPGSGSHSPAAAPVIVLVHGFDPTGDGYSCADYWGAAEEAFRRWDPSVRVVTVGSVSGDRDCDMTVGSGGPNTPIEVIGRELATDVYQRFSARGIPVALVGHSMGGLVVRSAVAQAGSGEGPPYLLVPYAVTISSPHGGTDALLRCGLAECHEMGFGSAFLRELEQDPQGRGGTVWTLFGSAADELVTPASAMGMQAACRFLYERPAYHHQPIVYDGSDATDARWREITAGSPVVRGGVPHSLRAIFLAATTGCPKG